MIGTEPVDGTGAQGPEAKGQGTRDKAPFSSRAHALGWYICTDLNLVVGLTYPSLSESVQCSTPRTSVGL